MKPIAMLEARQLFSSAFASEDADEKNEKDVKSRVREGLEPSVKSRLHQVMVSRYCGT